MTDDAALPSDADDAPGSGSSGKTADVPEPDVDLAVEANGLEFACLCEGDGDRLALCLHGFPDDAGSMRPLLDRLADAGFTAVAPYMRGYAPTDSAPDAGDAFAGETRVVKVRDAGHFLHQERPDVVGDEIVSFLARDG